eukprot:11597492-Ditylum_brightwellii.AAC.1
MATSAEVPMDLSIKFGNSQSPQWLKHKEPFDLIPQLGLKNNPAADYSEATKDKRGISKTITHCLKDSTISSRNAFCLYQNIWLPKMQYSLAVTSFSRTACVKIMKPFVRAILPKLGLNRNTACTIIYGSKQYGGSGLPFLSKVMGDRSYVPASWLSSIRTFLCLCKGT